MDKKIVIVLVVAVVAIAAVAAAILLMNGGEKGPVYEYEGRLPIFGNANNDDYINNDDVQFIQDIIDGKTTGSVVVSVLDGYDGSTINRSLADANADGVVDSKDVELVKKMVKREHGIKISYVNVDNVLSTCKYPLTTIGLAYKTVYELAAAAGLTSEEVKWVCDSVGDVPGKGELRQWYPQFWDAKCFGNRATPDYESMVGDMPSCIITGTKRYYVKTGEETLGPRGVDIIRLPTYEDGWAVPGMLMLGYLTDNEKKAKEYVDMADVVYKTIAKHVENIPMMERPFVFASHNASAVVDYKNGYLEPVVLAGASTAIDRGYPKGNVDPETIKQMDPEWILLQPWHGVLEQTDGSVIDTFKWDLIKLYEDSNKSIQAIDHTNAYKNGKVLMDTQGVRMGAASFILTAYIANHIYPGVFNFDVEKMFTDYMAKYHPGVDASEWFQYTYFDLEFADEKYEELIN
jgi:iron complex transport system substrate-binding protein